MPTHRLRVRHASTQHLLFAESEREARTVLDAMILVAEAAGAVVTASMLGTVGDHWMVLPDGSNLTVDIAALAPMRQTSGTIG
jgi:hypothetical protein